RRWYGETRVIPSGWNPKEHICAWMSWAGTAGGWIRRWAVCAAGPPGGGGGRGRGRGAWRSPRWPRCSSRRRMPGRRWRGRAGGRGGGGGGGAGVVRGARRGGRAARRGGGCPGAGGGVGRVEPAGARGPAVHRAAFVRRHAGGLPGPGADAELRPVDRPGGARGLAEPGVPIEDVPEPLLDGHREVRGQSRADRQLVLRQGMGRVVPDQRPGRGGGWAVVRR